MDDRFYKLKLILRNTQTDETSDVDFLIHENKTAQKWASYLLNDYLNSNEYFRLEKGFSLHGWRYNKNNPNSRNINTVIDQLNWCINSLNEYFLAENIDYHIDETFSYSMDREELNSLHHHFELLRGRVWDETPIYAAASNGVRWLINQLNECCHELENLFRAEVSYEHKMSSSAIVVCLYGPDGGIRHEMEPEDYHIFINENLKFGQIRMHYAQAGKTHREAFHDNDQDIHDENITGIRYLSGEFDVNLNCGPDGVHEEDLQDWADFFEWCKSKGLDTTDPTLALGWAPLADMDKSKFQNLSDFEIMKELYYYDDLFKMELFKLENNDEVLVGERSWDYTWRDLYERQKTEYFNLG